MKVKYYLFLLFLFVSSFVGADNPVLRVKMVDGTTQTYDYDQLNAIQNQIRTTNYNGFFYNAVEIVADSGVYASSPLSLPGILFYGLHRGSQMDYNTLLPYLEYGLPRDVGCFDPSGIGAAAPYLKKVDLGTTSGFQKRYVGTFFGCAALEEVVLPNSGLIGASFDHTFTNCSSLVRVKNMDVVGPLLGMRSVFKNCTNLRSVGFFQGGGANASNTRLDYDDCWYNCDSTFYGCANLEFVPGWDLVSTLWKSKVATFENSAVRGTGLNVPSVDLTFLVTDINDQDTTILVRKYADLPLPGAFYNAKRLIVNGTLSDFPHSYNSLPDMVKDWLCRKSGNVQQLPPYLEYIDLSGMDITSALANNPGRGLHFAYTFDGFRHLKTIKLFFHPTGVFDNAMFTCTFRGCESLENIYYLTSYSNISVIAPELFRGCSKLKRVEFYPSNTNPVNAEDMFNGCSSLESVTFEYLTNVTSLTRTFAYCPRLESIGFGFNVAALSNDKLEDTFFNGFDASGFPVKGPGQSRYVRKTFRNGRNSTVPALWTNEGSWTDPSSQRYGYKGFDIAYDIHITAKQGNPDTIYMISGEVLNYDKFTPEILPSYAYGVVELWDHPEDFHYHLYHDSHETLSQVHYDEPMSKAIPWKLDRTYIALDKPNGSKGESNRLCIRTEAAAIEVDHTYRYGRIALEDTDVKMVAGHHIKLSGKWDMHQLLAFYQRYIWNEYGSVIDTLDMGDVTLIDSFYIYTPSISSSMNSSTGVLEFKDHEVVTAYHSKVAELSFGKEVSTYQDSHYWGEVDLYASGGGRSSLRDLRQIASLPYAQCAPTTNLKLLILPGNISSGFTKVNFDVKNNTRLVEVRNLDKISNLSTLEECFQNCQSLRSLTFSSTSQSNFDGGAAYAFDGCTVLTHVNNFDKFTTLDDLRYTFRNCKALEEVHFGATLVGWDVNYYLSHTFQNAAQQCKKYVLNNSDDQIPAYWKTTLGYFNFVIPFTMSVAPLDGGDTLKAYAGQLLKNQLTYTRTPSYAYVAGYGDDNIQTKNITIYVLYETLAYPYRVKEEYDGKYYRTSAVDGLGNTVYTNRLPIKIYDRFVTIRYWDTTTRAYTNRSYSRAELDGTVGLFPTQTTIVSLFGEWKSSDFVNLQKALKPSWDSQNTDTCVYLQEVDMSNAVLADSIRLNYAFRNCTGLRLVTFPKEPSKMINMYCTFYGCSFLQRLINFQKVGINSADQAFKGCSSLREVYMSGLPAGSKRLTFSGTSEILRIHLPEGVAPGSYWSDQYGQFLSNYTLDEPNFPKKVKLGDSLQVEMPGYSPSWAVAPNYSEWYYRAPKGYWQEYSKSTSIVFNELGTAKVYARVRQAYSSYKDSTVFIIDNYYGETDEYEIEVVPAYQFTTISGPGCTLYPKGTTTVLQGDTVICMTWMNDTTKAFAGYLVDGVLVEDSIVYFIVADTSHTVEALTVDRYYTLTFQTQFGDLISTQRVEYRSDAVAPQAPAVPGYYFIGWDNNLTDIRASKVITAQYTPYSYYVAGNGGDDSTGVWCNGLQWQANGAPMAADTIVFRNVPAGSWEMKITNGTWATSYGYSSLSKTCSSPNVTGEDNIKVILTEPGDVRVAFDGDSVCVTGRFTHPDSVPISTFTMVGSGELLGNGWLLTDSTNDMTLSNESEYTLVKQHVALHTGVYYYKVVGDRSWSVFQYPAINNDSLVVDETGVYTLCFTFTRYPASLSVVALPEKNVVGFVDYNDSILHSELVWYGGAATPPADPVRTGYTFTGWSGNYSSVTENTTIKALYKAIRYRVVFLDYDSTLLKVDSVAYGSSAYPPSNPLRDGYIFSGWSADYSFITGDLTLVAQYQDRVPLTIAEFLTLQPNSNVELAPATVMYANGKYVYLEDATGYLVAYKNGIGSVFTQGQVLTGLLGNYQSYSGLPEFIPTTLDSVVVTDTVVVAPHELTEKPDQSNISEYVSIQNVLVTDSASYYYIYSDVLLFDQFRLGFTFAAGRYNFTGVISIYKNVLEFIPLTMEEASGTALSDEGAMRHVEKRLIDGKVYIIVDGRWYDSTGRALAPLQ